MRSSSASRGLFLLLTGCAAVRAQPAPLPFERIHSADGLSHNSVYAITQDRAGFLWFGTVDGLNRYDGYAFTVYRHDRADPASLSSNLVRALYEDRRGQLWVGTEGGVDRMDAGAERFARYDVPAARSGQRMGFALAEDAAGTLWAATAGGLLRYDAAADRFVRAAWWPPSAFAFDLRLDAQGHLWVLGATPDGTAGHLYRLDGAGRAVERVVVGAEWGRFERFDFDEQGRPWMNERGPGLRDGGRLRPAHPERPVSAFEVRRGPTGALWVGTSDGRGLCRADGDALRCQPLAPGSPAWLHNYVRSVFHDRAGALWVGTYGGVYRHDPHRKPFVLLRHDPHDPNSLSASAVSAVARTPDGARWVATFGGGLNRIDGAGRARAYRHRPGDARSLPDDVVWHLLVDRRGQLWMATNGGVARYDPAAETFHRYPLRLPPGAGTAAVGPTFLAEDPAGKLWVATFQGLFHLDPATGQARYYPAGEGRADPTSIGVTAVLIEDAQTLWVAGAQGRLSRLHVPTRRFTHFVPRDDRGAPLTSEAAYALHRTADGTLWLATGAGLLHFKPSVGTFRVYGVADGLPGAVAYSITEDARGALWVGTNRGLARLDPARGTFRAYDLSDGIGTMEFNRHATFRDADGTLYVGGVDGLTVFHPDRVRDNPHVPPVVFTRIETDGRDGAAMLNPAALARLTLTPRQSAVTFEFAALNFTDPHKNRYAYRLEGLDDDWVEAGTQRTARYASLPPGRYTFRVRAANNDGVWNLQGAALPVTVLPPFWRTWWFRFLGLAAVAAALAVAYRLRVRRLLAVERLRLRIAGDLHDDLSTDLSGIALVTDLLHRHPNLADDDRRQLAEVRDTALAMVDGLRDIVWTINPEHDTLEAMVRRMRQVAARLLTGLDHTFEADVPAGAHAVAMTLRRDVLLLYKEALHNVARHARATRVSVRLAQRDGHLDLTVEDDGQGFDPEQVEGGHGLRSMRARAAALHADLDVVSRPGAGTRLHLRLPMA
ncbi:MAG TPA: two-component regulator propeller domain-containing protein [Rubricoccaceae bacterium]|nr:two-component regulator propeller domain-containing protein [Rubricoccaceae bacterium]